MPPALAPVSLDRGWQVSTDGGAIWRPLVALAAYPRDRLPLRLRCAVYLHPAEICVRYILRLDCAPTETAVVVNGWRVGVTRSETAFQANVTDQVALENNVIELEVSAAGDLRGVVLQPVPCT